jgi:NADPH2:quinone reductase
MSSLFRVSRVSSRLINSSAAGARLVALSNQITPRFTTARTMASIPKTMKGVYIEKTGGTEVLEYREDVPVPEPKDGEVLVKNEYIGINYIDT